ncbi:hypothetical protein P170DRAFT_502180 [Aspergillus steynii IBT 23096]|uniref:Uncharacterized protein n=1 Tax=Aspergillus steynii IBT 23096 TaxID=1392250 RepID=A0A2I2FWY0_9EURO|nr:uncharacterized protein P170DRAFT_502180 [Aspergillus steynii IBT 23096]PLB45117.1 hypothetical protein P170DRAFT_502180 [Aspergillus steynii IBT 23096]
MVHLMRETLDQGELTVKKRDREFTTFLDLKQEYHHEFINRLREYVQNFGPDWVLLEQSEDERESCAKDFVEAWGNLYWGTETNRQTHLLQDSLDEPESLCVYPERKIEIIEAVTILLERKARSILKGQTRQSLESVNTPSAPNIRPAAPSSAPQPAIRKMKRKKVERRSESPSSDDEFRRHSARKTTEPAQPIRPFNSIVVSPSPEREIPERSKPTARLQANTQDLTTFSTPTTASTGNGSSSAMSAQTHFLVTAFYQQVMSPIWLPYKKFTSSASFLSHMFSEGTLKNWDSGAYAQKEGVASVKFGWSDFEILIRPGHNQDLAMLMERLEKAWQDSEVSMDSNFYDGFKVLVFLHVKK